MPTKKTTRADIRRELSRFSKRSIVEVIARACELSLFGLGSALMTDLRISAAAEALGSYLALKKKIDAMRPKLDRKPRSRSAGRALVRRWNAAVTKANAAQRLYGELAKRPEVKAALDEIMKKAAPTRPRGFTSANGQWVDCANAGEGAH